MSNIPLIIHQIWWQGYENIPKQYIIYRNTWLKKHTNWTFFLWDKKKFEFFINKIGKELLYIYNKLPLMIQKIDIAKYVILYYFGGIYIDLDTICENKIDYLLNKFKNKNLILSKIDVYDDLNYKLINNGIIITNKYHKFFLYMFYEIMINYQKQIYQNKDLYILESTGPIAFSKAVLNYLLNSNNRDIIILNSNYLESCKMTEIGKCKKAGIFITHVHSGSWQSNLLKLHFYVISYYKKLKMKIILILILIFFFFN